VSRLFAAFVRWFIDWIELDDVDCDDELCDCRECE
jgi:hypothetical protein